MLSSLGVLDGNKYRLVSMRLCIQYIFIHEDLTRSTVVDAHWICQPLMPLADVPCDWALSLAPCISSILQHMDNDDSNIWKFPP